MAHEIGHLLLGPNAHSTAGIMQMRWDPTQIRLAVMRRLFFTDEQSKIMRAHAYSQMKLQASPGEQRVRTGDQQDGKQEQNPDSSQGASSDLYSTGFGGKP